MDAAFVTTEQQEDGPAEAEKLVAAAGTVLQGTAVAAASLGDKTCLHSHRSSRAILQACCWIVCWFFWLRSCCCSCCCLFRSRWKGSGLKTPQDTLE